MTLLLVLAAVLLVASGFLVRAATASSRYAARLTATATSTCAELLDEAAAVGAQLGAAALLRETELKGTGSPLGVPLVGPFSGQPVLWYSATTTHVYWKTSHSTDSQGRRTSSRSRQRDVVSSEVSDTARIAVSDGTGSVEVALRDAQVDGARVLHEQLRPPPEGSGGPSLSIGPITLGGGNDTIGYEYRELALVAGEPLYVCGTARPAPGGGVEVATAPGRELLVSTRSEEQLVRHALRRGQWLGAGAVAAGLGAVAAVVGAVVVGR